MNKNKNKIEKPDNSLNDSSLKEVTDILYSSTYGISPEFIKNNDDLLDKTRKILSEKLTIKNNSTKEKNTNSSNVAEYVRLISSVMNDSERMNLLQNLKDNEKFINPSGSHSIMENSNFIDKLSDSSVIDELMHDIQNHFVLMPEYSKVCELIPELGKCIEILVKDIINRDEFTHSFINNFYKDNDGERKTIIETRIKELLKEYDFEGKIRKWIKDAEIIGVKPFSVLPQKDVITMINNEITGRYQHGRSIESLTVEDIFKVDEMLIKSPIESTYVNYVKYKLNIKSLESDDDIRLFQSVESDIDKFVDSILTPDIIDEWSDICTENLREMFEEEKINKANDLEKFNDICSSMESFEKSINDPKNLFNKQDILKKQLKDMVVCFDRSVEVVDPMKTPIYQASKKLKNNKYGNAQHLVDNGIIEDFYRTSDNIEGFNKKEKVFNIDGFDINISDKPIDIDKYVKNIKNKRAILTEYEPEHVIPVSSGGTHIGYYVVEYIRTSGDNFLLLKKDRGSFLDIIRRLGVGEDKALVSNTGTTAVDTSNPFSSGAFSPSTIMNPLINNGFTGSSSPAYSGVNYESGLYGISNRKTELIKTLMIKTISKRLGDDTLSDNGTFQSALMNLIRDDIMFRNKVRFTFIPESHMVYMSRELDSGGYPLSIFNGTLFNCYIYIASLISSIMMKVMKSSDTEVMEVNVGKSKNLGLTIGSISQNASTRNVTARSLFGGTDNIVRTVGNFKRLIVPVIDGEKLYDINQVEHVNNVDIDDEFTDRIIKSIVLKIGIPPTSLDMLSQDEYVASQTQHRLDYRNLVVDRGVNYAKFITKAIKLLVYYSDIIIPDLDIDNTDEGNDKNKTKRDEGINIDIGNIDFSFAIPKSLSIIKIADELNGISDLVDNIIKIYFGEEDVDNEEYKKMLVVIKKNLMKALSSSTDWSMIDDIVENSRRENSKEFNDSNKIPPVKDNEDPSVTDDEGSGDDYGY